MSLRGLENGDVTGDAGGRSMITVALRFEGKRVSRVHESRGEAIHCLEKTTGLLMGNLKCRGGFLYRGNR